MVKKIIIVIISSILCVASGVTGMYLAKNHYESSNKSNQVVANTVQQESSEKSKPENNINSNNNKTEVKDSKSEDDKYNLNGVNTFPLTKQEFKEAMQKGIEHKTNSKNIINEKIINRLQNNEIQKIVLITPYLNVASESEKMARNYQEPSAETILKAIGKNNFMVSARVQGNDISFYKNIHLVLKLYDNQQKLLKVVQPVEGYGVDRNIFDSKEDANGSGANYEWSASIGEMFPSEEIMEYNPTMIETVLIFSDGHENSQWFVLSTLNKL